MARVTWSGLGVSSAAHLDDHVGHGLANAGDQLVELRQALAALAIKFAHVQMQHGGAGVVAVDRLLDLRFHGDRDVFREVADFELGAVGRHRDDEFFLVLGVERSVDEIHDVSP
jgi:hypothetical protein